MADVQKFDISEGNIFVKQLQEESDRGAALVGVAYLDELLTRLFRSRMLLSKTG